MRVCVCVFGHKLVFPQENFDWGIAKSMGFGCWLNEIVRFVPSPPPQAPKIVKLRHFYVFVIQKTANVTSFRKKYILRKTLKIEFYSTF